MTVVEDEFGADQQADGIAAGDGDEQGIGGAGDFGFEDFRSGFVDDEIVGFERDGEAGGEGTPG